MSTPVSYTHLIFTLIFPVIIFADDNFENPNPTFELEEDDNSIHVEVHGNIGIPPDYDGELPELETQYETQIDGMDFDIHFDLETTYIEETESEQDDSDDIILPDETPVSYTHLDVYKRQPLL